MNKDSNTTKSKEFTENLEAIFKSPICEEISFIKYIVNRPEIKELLLLWPSEIKNRMLEEYIKLEKNEDNESE